MIHSRVKNIDSNTLEVFARILHLSCESADIFPFDLDDYEYFDDEIALIASQLLHDDNDPTLVKNEVVKYYNLTAQILAKIVFYNLLPKSGEYSHAKGCDPLLMYCLLRGIRLNIPKHIMISCFQCIS